MKYFFIVFFIVIMLGLLNCNDNKLEYKLGQLVVFEVPDFYKEQCPNTGILVKHVFKHMEEYTIRTVCKMPCMTKKSELVKYNCAEFVDIAISDIDIKAICKYPEVCEVIK